MWDTMEDHTRYPMICTRSMETCGYWIHLSVVSSASYTLLSAACIWILHSCTRMARGLNCETHISDCSVVSSQRTASWEWALGRP